MNDRYSPLADRRLFLTGAASLALTAVAACAPAAGADEPPQWSFGYGPNPPANYETAYLAGGCFWGVQAVFAHVKGVKESISGYTGGHIANPNYNQVSSGLSGHAETVRVVYDPNVITYDEILDIFFTVATDPTQLNRQGPDIGTQYRNEIYVTSEDHRRRAGQFIARLDRSGTYSRPVVTKVTRLEVFYPAELYHQDYLFKNPRSPYIIAHDMPKLAALEARFPTRWQDPATLLASTNI